MKPVTKHVFGSVFVAIAMIAFGSLLNEALAVERPARGESSDIPITVQTQDRKSDELARQLLARAREKGELPVIVGLRMELQREDSLSAVEIDKQRQALRGMQSRVIGHAFGREPDQITRYRYIPFMAFFANEGELRKLLIDREVTSIQEEVPSSPQLNDTVPLIHADDADAKYGVSGVGQVVAILDTGVAKLHPMLLGKVVSEACYSTNKPGKKIASLCPGGVAHSTATGSGRNCAVSLPNCYHGTHAASIAAGGPVGSLRGVASSADIIAIQIFSRYDKAEDCTTVGQAPCIRYLDQDLISGLERVYQLRGKYKIAAANMSVGGRPLFSGDCDAAYPAYSAIFAKLRAAGIAPVVAAGNYGVKDRVAQPSCVSAAITVGATTKADWDKQVEQVAGKGDGNSDFGDPIELMAPGAHVLAAVPNGADCIPNASPYCRLSGTSEAAPHVAGAFAVLKQTRPNASVDDILEALECSGKRVEWPEGSGLDKPRIDLLGAYEWLQKVPNAKRSWDFDEAADALDWTPFISTWLASNGRYVPEPIPKGVVLSSTANCNKSLEVTAKMRRVYAIGEPDDGNIAPTAGILLKSKLDYRTRKVSGYFFGYLYLPRFPTVNERGIGFIQRIDESSSTVLCREDVDVPVNFRDWNTVKAVSDGSSQQLYLNDKLICEIDDATYESGPVSAATGFSDDYPTTGGTFAVDSVSIKSREAAAPKSVRQNAIGGRQSLQASQRTRRLSFDKGQIR